MVSQRTSKRIKMEHEEDAPTQSGAEMLTQPIPSSEVGEFHTGFITRIKLKNFGISCMGPANVLLSLKRSNVQCRDLFAWSVYEYDCRTKWNRKVHDRVCHCDWAIR